MTSEHQCEEDVWDLLNAMRLDEHTTFNFDVNDGDGSGSGSGSGSGAGAGANVDIDQDVAICGDCKSTNLIVDEGVHICMNCTSVQGRVIDTGAEWRYYGADDSRGADPARCGLATNDLLPKSSIGTVIGYCRSDNRDMRRIRMFQMWNSMPYWERTLYSVFDKLMTNTINHGVPSKVIDDAKVLYKRASEKKISRGDNKEGLIASCIYYACLLNKIPRSPKEVARMFNIDPNVLTKGNARFQSLLQMNVDSSNPDDYVARFGSKLNMNFQDIQACKRLALQIDEMEIVSQNSPTSVAAGCLYFHCMNRKLPFSKKAIATVCEVSEVTITKCHKCLMKYKSVLLESISFSDTN